MPGKTCKVEQKTDPIENSPTFFVLKYRFAFPTL